jgi:RNA polymerase sigma factor (TIGR02999 family)
MQALFALPLVAMVPAANQARAMLFAGGYSMQPEGEITLLLARLGHGERAVEVRLLEQVYVQLKALAKQALQGNVMAQINPTDLVHELYLRNVDAPHLSAQNRREFFAIAAHRMRQVLVDLARARAAEKRGNGLPELSLSQISGRDGVQATSNAGLDILALEQALQELQSFDARKAKVVEMRYFGGADMAMIAECLGVTRMTVHRDWEVARTFLFDKLSA